jgi:NAD(P)-dependent dehydrogenase (short-subunit alcohol dehydrogenase family)
MTSPGRTVLVTGTGKGIGRACALELDARGFRVYAGVRHPDDGESLRAATNGRIVPLPLDVTDAAQVAAAGGLLTEVTGAAGLWGLVNNAGTVYAGPMEHLPVYALRDQLEVNVVGAVALTQACLPSLRRARGRIVNVSSVNGRIVSPFSGAYAASKFALEAVSDAFRRELARVNAGVRVIVIQPGAVETPLWEVSRERALAMAENYPPEALAQYPWLVRGFQRIRVPRQAAPATRVASVIGRALTARWPRSRYRVGWDARLGVLAAWLLPDGALDGLLNARQRRFGPGDRL